MFVVTFELKRILFNCSTYNAYPQSIDYQSAFSQTKNAMAKYNAHKKINNKNIYLEKVAKLLLTNTAQMWTYCFVTLKPNVHIQNRSGTKKSRKTKKERKQMEKSVEIAFHAKCMSMNTCHCGKRTKKEETRKNSRKATNSFCCKYTQVVHKISIYLTFILNKFWVSFSPHFSLLRTLSTYLCYTIRIKAKEW